MNTIAERKNRRLDTTASVVNHLASIRINVKSGCVLSYSKERKETIRRIEPANGWILGGSGMSAMRRYTDSFRLEKQCISERTNHMNVLVALLVFGAFILKIDTGIAQEQRPKEALLIANGDYSHFGKLPNPILDARILKQTLEEIGFRVSLIENCTREGMLDALNTFHDHLKLTRGIGLFHYGGHGVQVSGKNYLIPADADIPDERRVATRAVDLDEVMSSMDDSGASVNIVVLDACRDNPLPKTTTRSTSRGLTVVESKPKNSIIVFAAEAGSKAEDGLFTPTLAKLIKQPGISLAQVMMKVRREVAERSNGSQTPGEYNQLFEDVYLCGMLQGSGIMVNNESEKKIQKVKYPKILSFEDAQASANAGDSYAQAVVSIYFGLGYMTERNELRAKDYAMKSVKQLNPLGIYWLGVMRDHGTAMDKNKEQAEALYEKALPGLKKLTDDPYALAAVANIMERRGKSINEVILAYKRSADNGFAPAQNKCANLLKDINPVEAEKYSKMANQEGFNAENIVNNF